MPILRDLHLVCTLFPIGVHDAEGIVHGALLAGVHDMQVDQLCYVY